MSRDKAFTATNFVSVTGSSTSIVAANPNRTELTLINDNGTAANVVYLSLGGTATLNTGIRLNGVGGNITLSNYSGAITGIATSNPTKVLITEI